MTDSRARARTFGLSLAACCLLAIPAAGQYRTGQDPSQALPKVEVAPPSAPAPPLSLGPRSADDAAAGGKGSAQGDTPRTLQLRIDPETGKPLTAEEIRARDAAAPTPGAAAAPPQTDDGEAIRVQTLRQVDPGSIGLLEEQQGGFGLYMWRDTSRDVVVATLPRLPLPATSRAVRSLARRLLLSVAEAPVGRTASGPADSVNLLGLRVERLVAAGWYRDAEALLKQAPQGSVGPTLASARLDSLLLVGNVRDACRLVRNYLEVAESAEWQKATAFCLAIDQQVAQVELYEQLLYENGIEDSAFFGLLGALTGRDLGPVTSLPEPRPLHLAMLRTARRAIPDDAAGSANPAVLRAIATSPNATLNLRLAAAERAHALGLLETTALGRIYASVPFTAQQRADVLAQAKELPASMAAALLYQVAQIEELPAGKARVLQLAFTFNSGRATGRLTTAVEVNFEALEKIEPSPDLGWFAADAARALLVAGEWEQAAEWLRAVLEPAQQGDEAAAGAVLELMPLLAVGDPKQSVPVVEDAVEAWWRSEVAGDRADRFDRAALFFGLLGAFEQEVPRVSWEALVAGPPAAGYVPSPGVLHSLRDAGTQGRRGEAVLLSLIALGRGGPAAAASPVLAEVTTTLRQVGLEADARMLALEAMIGRGF